MSKDRRRHPRVAMLEQAVLIHGDEHHLCRLRDVSAGGASIAVQSRPALGAAVTLFADEIGRFEATVVRHSEQGLALRFIAGDHRRQRLCDKLNDYLHWTSSGPGALGVTQRQRLLLEALAFSGRVAAPRLSPRVLFRQTLEECRSRGWVTVNAIGEDFLAVEITLAGREQVLRAMPETVA